jgi:hypothetical protein
VERARGCAGQLVHQDSTQPPAVEPLARCGCRGLAIELVAE